MYVTLTNCEVLSLTRELLEIKPASGAMGDSLNNPTVFARVREVAAEHFGGQIEVRLASKAESAGRNGVSVQALENDRAARQRAQAKDDPLVRRAVEKFGGTIKEISLIEE